MDSIHAAKKIFNSSLYSYQIHSSAIFCELRDSFEQNSNNSIEFWDCPSSCKWSLHNIVDKETKKFDLTPIFLCKSSWDFSRKMNAITFSTAGRCISKLWITKDNIF